MSSLISTKIDFDKDGIQHGYLQLLHSVHRSAYGYIPIPIASMKNGDGPTVLLMAGNHGDEYEGQVILSNMIRTLPLDQIRGQLIILPMANFPAAEAGLRTSPIDQGNLNRSFPGSDTGTPTQQIAHYIEHTLLKRADFLFDLHSGGSSLFYTPTLLFSVTSDDPHLALKREIAEAFSLPHTLYFGRSDAGSFSSSAAFRNGVCSILTELAGGGTVSKGLPKLAGDGLLRSLHKIGAITTAPDPAPKKSRIFNAEGSIFATEPGVYEPLADPGEDVRAGQPAALIHRTETPGRDPIELCFEDDGVILAKRQGARVVRGDCLFHIGQGEEKN
ncbi:succinylglutamate desuccinylase/aspartoacylase family protein [Sneathiella sp. HT1-7]|uniref:succinylglutamate desuccinylase/aspartoacylase family protein n=1 Tax=Sneathiella sp. HT1-7 TaxID=2887192 RepID=UPI001D143C82|nr:succinylglutamate desuccinylase/aspartoacylase family protein [Sneathiella sp. HT1-7]MCC3305399.1 succinylglutamate desuccinylase/aspartoacylase family protein [Sneathiella sp. HT1-7]